MCTVVGYIGDSLCSTFIFEGLARLEYRGYDSAGFACLDAHSNKLLYSKSSGQLINLTERVKKDMQEIQSQIKNFKAGTNAYLFNYYQNNKLS